MNIFKRKYINKQYGFLHLINEFYFFPCVNISSQKNKCNFFITFEVCFFKYSFFLILNYQNNINIDECEIDKIIDIIKKSTEPDNTININLQEYFFKIVKNNLTKEEIQILLLILSQISKYKIAILSIKEIAKQLSYNILFVDTAINALQAKAFIEKQTLKNTDCLEIRVLYKEKKSPIIR